MATPIGTYTLSDLRSNRFTSVMEFGIDNINAILQRDLASHNEIVVELMAELADRSTDKQRIYGASIDGDMVLVDEFARSATKKPAVGSGVGFPLNNHQYPVGWDERWVKRATVGELAERALAAETAHQKAIRREIKKALYLSTNYTFRDINSSPIADLAVKRLVNADSMAIPNAPDGTTFTASSHTHYLGTATLTAAGFTAAINTVIEHGFGERIISAINYADEAAVRALTGFVPAQDFRIIPASTTAHTIETMNPGSYYNRFVGIFGAAEVWVKPWAIANYVFTWDAGSVMKPLVFREDTVAGFQGLRLAAQLDTYPLYAQYFEAMFGLGCWNRTNGSSWYFANATYADPTITQ
jgi:hypothetical protein